MFPIITLRVLRAAGKKKLFLSDTESVAYLDASCVAFRGWFVFVGAVFKLQFPFCDIIFISLSRLDQIFLRYFRCFCEAPIRVALSVVQWENKGRLGEALTDE